MNSWNSIITRSTQPTMLPTTTLSTTTTRSTIGNHLHIQRDRELSSPSLSLRTPLLARRPVRYRAGTAARSAASGRPRARVRSRRSTETVFVGQTDLPTHTEGECVLWNGVVLLLLLLYKAWDRQIHRHGIRKVSYGSFLSTHGV